MIYSAITQILPQKAYTPNQLKQLLILLNFCLLFFCTVGMVQAQTTFNYSGTSSTYTVPANVSEIKIEISGGQGGNGNGGAGGAGATMIGTFTVSSGDVLDIIVGGAGQKFYNSGGGGAGSGVLFGGSPLIIAGGGGGAGTNEAGKPGLITTNGGSSSGLGGNSGLGGQKGFFNGDCGWASGGGGLLGDGYGGNSSWDGGPLPGTLGGTGAGRSWANGGAGGINGGGCYWAIPNNGAWGLGGGGAGSYGGGGGGGYSGGAGGQYREIIGYRGGGGGGSINNGTNQSNISGNNQGAGIIIITVTAIGLTPPNAVCTNFTGQLDASGNLTINASDVDGGSWDAEGSVTLSVSPNTFTCANIGFPVTVTLSATNNLGLTDSCTAVVTVVDEINPEITCPADQVVVLNASCASTMPDYTAVNASDNCSVTVTQLPIAGTPYNGDQNVLVTLIADDGNGNTVDCSFNVHFDDQTPPEITCPADQVVVLDANCDSIMPDYTVGVASDNCSVTVTQSPTPGTAYNGDQNVVVTLIADDGNGNTVDCSFNVHFDDQTPPVITCPADQVVVLDANCDSIMPDYTVGVATDNCSVTITQSPTPGTAYNGDQNVVVTLTADDGNGNTVDCSFNVNFDDQIAPTAVTQNVIVELDTNGIGNTTAEAVNNGSSDNCGIASLVLSRTDFDCNDIGNHIVTLTVTDVNGNMSQETVNVDVQDKVPPIVLTNNVIVVLDANGNGSTTVAAVNNGVSDNCGVASVLLSKTDFDCNYVGNNTVTLIVTDVNGNVTNETANVDVQDNIAPELTDPQHVAGFVNSNCEFIVPDYTNLTLATDNCNTVTVTQSPIAGTVITDFTASLAVILTANDGNGNTATVTVTGSYALAAAGATLWYIDADGDGYGDASYSIWSCTQPDGYALNNRDCDDTNPYINPRVAEILNNSVDENCDGYIAHSSLSNSSFILDNLIISPNPFNNSLNIDLSNGSTGEFKISLFDLNGRLVFSKNTSGVNGRITVNGLEKLASAVYFLKIVDKSTYEYTVKRLIKE